MPKSTLKTLARWRSVAGEEILDNRIEVTRRDHSRYFRAKFTSARPALGVAAREFSHQKCPSLVAEALANQVVMVKK